MANGYYTKPATTAFEHPGGEDVHPDYDYYSTLYLRIREVLAGSDVVKGEGIKYLPKLDGQTDTEYSAYVTRANFVNMTEKVLSAMMSQVVRKSPVVNMSDSQSDHIETATNLGNNLYETIVELTQEVLAMSRVGVLVDNLGSRSYMVIYRAEDILNWSFCKLTATLKKVTLREQQVDDNAVKYRYRTLELVDGIYKVTIRHIDGTEEEIYPTMSGMHLDFIPFIVASTYTTGDPDPIKPNLIDVADINLSHFRSSADLEHGRHFCAIPTAIITGANPDTVLKLGGGTAIVLPEVNGKWGFLEFTGTGLRSLEKALEEKQGQLAMFSARMVDQSSSQGSESASAIQQRYSAESASLTRVARVIEITLTKALKWLFEWDNISTDFELTLPKDFMTTKLSAAEINSLTNALIEGTIDKTTFAANLVRGDILAPERFEEEANRDVPPVSLADIDGSNVGMGNPTNNGNSQEEDMGLSSNVDETGKGLNDKD